MRTKTPSVARRINRGLVALPAVITDDLALLSSAGLWEQMEGKARALTVHHPGQVAGWRALGTAFSKLGKWTQAANALSRVAKRAPGDAATHNDLGYALYKLGREEEAEAWYFRALRVNPRLADAHNNLGALLADLGRLAEAARHLQKSLELEPNSAFVHYCLGSLIYRVGTHDGKAVAYLERSIAIDPNGVDACLLLGNALLRTGQFERSAAMFRRAQKLRPVVTWRARKDTADFSALFLYAPGNGCTPIEYLVRRASYDCHFYCVMPDAPEHLDLLRAKADVVVNMIADADYGKEILPFAHDLVDCLDRPTVNRPGLIMATDRAGVACRLAGIAGCRIPKTVCLSGAALAEAIRNGSLDAFSLPVLVRLAGTHGGEDFEKLDDFTAVADFAMRRPEADHYLTEYVEYRSPDGFFRKYRLICVDGELFPYHLAIHDEWKVHHFRTDMANHAWMRAEEEAFLKDPHRVFDDSRQNALRIAATATGLDYCGIDCALDVNGEIVVFETNAAMLVHDEKDKVFTYKNPYIARIKDAFDAMLCRRASGGTRPVTH